MKYLIAGSVGLAAGVIVTLLLLICIAKKRNKKKMKKMDKIMILIFLTVLAFTITMIWVFVRCESVPDTLIVSFFAATIGECSATGYIKGQNIKNNTDSDDEPTRR